MATRESKLVYSQAGADQVRGRVISLTDALEAQKRKQSELVTLMPKARAEIGLVGSVSQSASAKITSLTNTLGPMGAGLGAISRAASPAAQGLLAWASAAEKASAMSRLMNSTLLAGTVGVVAGGAVFAAYADDLLRAADNYSTLHARIRTFSDGQIAAAQNERDIYAAARESRVAVSDLTTLYTRLAPAVKDYGRSQQDALTITQLTSKALAIQGADVREQAAATVQFSQAIASGVLRGDELRSLLESSPQLLRYVAQNLEINGKVGVAFSSLRKLGENGALSANKIVDALLKAAPAIERDFVNAPKTAQQGWIVLKDEITRTVGTLDKAVGGQKAVVDWLAQMSAKAEEFRQKMATNPQAFDGIKQAADFVGGAVASIGALGKVAVDNFDLIVSAGQALLALKLGSVISSWFAQAATASKAAVANLVEYQQTARFQVGATQAPVLAQAATAARSASLAADARALELQAQAELKAAQAANMHTAAYEAQNLVNRQKVEIERIGTASAEQNAAVARAQATATSLKVQADRAEVVSKTAAARATDAATVAAERAVIAKTAEAAVTGNVTRAAVLQTAAMRAMTGVYNLLGGGIGIATIAIGGLIYALYKSEEAYRRQLDTQREAMLVGDRLKSITDQMTSATWAQIPALQAQTEALLKNAEAERQKALATIQRLEAEKRDISGFQTGTPGGFATAGAARSGQIAREVRDQQGLVASANAEAWKNSQELIRQDLVKATIQASTIQRQLTGGKDLAGRPLTEAGKTDLEKQLSGLFEKGQKAVDEWDARLKNQQGVVAGAKGGAKAGAAEVQGIYAGIFDVATQLVSTASKSTATPPPTTNNKPVAVPGGVSAAYTDLLKSGFLQLDGGAAYAAKNGQVTRNGQAVMARSDDEATALARYVKIVESLNDATDDQIKKEADKLGVQAKSRTELKQAAGAILDRELATSKAAQADDRWQDIQAEMAGTTRSQIKAEKDLQDMIRNGLQPKQEDVDKYKAWIAAREKASKLAEQLQLAQGPVQRGFEAALASSTVPTDARGAVDEVAAVKRIEQAKAAVLLDAQRAVAEEIDRLKKSGQISEAEAERKRVDMLAGYAVAVEIKTQEQLLEIRRERLQQSVQAAEQQAAESADAIVGALKDATFGGDLRDVGKRLGNDLLSAIYDEILGNPMRLLIKTTIRDLMGTGGSGVGLFSGILNAGLGVFGRANLSTTVATTIAKNPLLFADGRVPGFADGRSPWMDGPFLRGRGGPRGDDNLVRVSDQEAIINAKSSRIYARQLREINEGTYDPYAALKLLAGPPAYADGRAPYGAGMPHIPAVNVVQKQGDVILNNNTGTPMTASRRTDSNGNTHLDLRPLADQMARSAGRSGALNEGLRQSPRPIKRG